jgi:hypothetical protein
VELGIKHPMESMAVTPFHLTAVVEFDKLDNVTLLAVIRCSSDMLMAMSGAGRVAPIDSASMQTTHFPCIDGVSPGCVVSL